MAEKKNKGKTWYFEATKTKTETEYRKDYKTCKKNMKI